MEKPSTAREAEQHSSWTIADFNKNWDDKEVLIKNKNSNDIDLVPQGNMRTWKVKKLVGDKY
jgi:hypothetical protein